MKRALLVAGVFVYASMAAPVQAAPFEMRVPVLMYHRIACTRPNGTYSSLFVCPTRFDAHMQALKNAGWRSITADDLARAMATRTCVPAKTLVISIDDGALDGYKNGAPILERYGFRATYYMVAGEAGDYLTQTGLQKPHFSWPQARDLVRRGHGVGNHTWTHVSVATLTQTKWQNQVVRAQNKLTSELGFAPLTFAYPYGSYSLSSAEKLSTLFAMAFTTEAGARHSTSRMLMSPRVRVSRSTSPQELVSKVYPHRFPCG